MPDNTYHRERTELSSFVGGTQNPSAEGRRQKAEAGTHIDHKMPKGSVRKRVERFRMSLKRRVLHFAFVVLLFSMIPVHLIRGQTLNRY
jgi:hypothetical protein